MQLKPPRHIVWSTEALDLGDPFQRRWYLRQVLLYGRSEDVRRLDLDELADQIDDLNLPQEVESLWQTFLRRKGYAPR
ncbi:MAG TPA: hypothetical protein ENI60_00630 [Candidatus Fraserbacteria bacterium]|nr:hypothetical protein [Candidatus Fraserbacteria bacterium]